MKVLLIAYEFPPSPSPQSLRWTYLARELARRGHEIHVLAPDLGPGGPAVDPAIVVHRTWAGPLRGLIARQRRRRLPVASGDASAPQPSPHAARPSWKARVVNILYRISERVVFPDIRGEWRRPAGRELAALVRRHRFDVLITSHEPATCLQLGLQAKRAFGLPWIADLGDPVLAGYTPRRWRRRALRLERATCATADAVTVTAVAARDLLVARHAPARSPQVLTQGFEPRPTSPLPARNDVVELAYVGSFYDFRPGEALFEAVAAVPGIRLTVATVRLPSSLQAIAERHADRIRVVGFLDHADALALQSRSHVLVNLANADASQVPGKLYEYLGAGRPILHISHGGPDPGAALVESLRRGWVVENEREAIARRLVSLRDSGDRAWEAVDLSPEPVESFSWPAIGERLDAIVRSVARASEPPRVLDAGQAGQAGEHRR